MKRAATSITGASKKGPPRNRPLFDQGQLVRAEIRALLEKHPPLAPPLTPKQICIALGNTLKLRTAQWHMQAIRSTYVASRAIQISAAPTHNDTYGNAYRVESNTTDIPETRLQHR